MIYLAFLAAFAFVCVTQGILAACGWVCVAVMIAVVSVVTGGGK